MKQYLILFYHKDGKNKIRLSSEYYREFETKMELLEWCKDTLHSCKFTSYQYFEIPIEQYLHNIN